MADTGSTQCSLCLHWFFEHSPTCPRLDPWDLVFSITDERHQWFRYGAAVAFGLMGMAEAIKRQYDTWRCAKCGMWAHEMRKGNDAGIGLCKCPWPST